MSHKHYNCTCDHASVKFCKTCQLVHCLDCNKEWKQAVAYTYPYGYGFLNQTIAPANIGLGTYNGKGIQYGELTKVDNTLKDGHTVTVNTTTCEHKA